MRRLLLVLCVFGAFAACNSPVAHQGRDAGPTPTPEPDGGPPPETFTVGGGVTGLRGKGLVLHNGSDVLPVAAGGVFAFGHKLQTGAAYDVQVETQPTAPRQTCAVARGEGVVGSDNITTVEVSCTTNRYSIGGLVNGLAGSGLRLRDNGGDEIEVTSDWFEFPAEIESGGTYRVEIAQQPLNPMQVCEVINGLGTVTNSLVENVQVVCVTSAFALGGWVSGLSGTVTLTTNGQETSLTGDGTFAFANPIESGAAYDVQVKQQPVGQTCTVTNGAGTVADRNIANVQVSCAANRYSVGGLVSGLAGTLALKINNGETATVSGDGPFTFSTPLVFGSTYDVSVSAQPGVPSQQCVVTNGHGTVSAANVTSIVVTCTTNRFQLGGTVSGLAGVVTLQTNGQEVSVSRNGSFVFINLLESGTAYDVQIKTQPAGQTCTVTDGAGSLLDKAILSVKVSCAANTYVVGGALSGLISGSVTLSLGGGAQTKTITTDGPFAFNTPIVYGASYSVTIGSQPDGQTCTVTNGSGSMPMADVTNIVVSCTPNLYSVRGIVSGLVDGGVVLTLYGGTQTQTVFASGGFVFSTPIPYASTYAVVVGSQPDGQSCLVTNGMGQVPAGPVNNVVVICTPKTFTVGGVVSGLMAGNSVVISAGGANRATVTSNTSFTLPTVFTYGSSYTVTVATQPTGQFCEVTNGAGTVPASAVTNVVVSCTPNTYAVGGTMTGLMAGGQLTVSLNSGAQTKTVSENGAFFFDMPVGYGSSYTVSLATQPTGQTCTLANGSGTVPTSNVTNIAITCTPNSYSLGGTVGGLMAGKSVTLSLNGSAQTKTLAANGSFAFATSIAYGLAYTVTVSTQPTGQTCTVTNGIGSMPASNVTDVSVSCDATTYPLGGSVNGLLTGGSVTLSLNSGAQTKIVSANGSYTFIASVAYNSTYSVAVATQPTGQTCTVASGSGTMPASSITNVNVTCTTNTYSLGGTVSGLIGGTMTLSLNGGAQTKTVSANGAYTFTSSVGYGVSYSVTISTQPTGQACTVANGSGTMPGASVTNVNVSCVPNTYSLGGTVSGLMAGNSVVLSLNSGAQTKTVSANGGYTFDTSIAYGSSYSVTVATQPVEQLCTVVNASSTMGVTNVTNVNVSCVTNKYSLGGTVSGLIGVGGTLTLSLNSGAQTKLVTANGAYTFSSSIAYGTSYSVTIATQPSGQTCTLVNGSGTMSSSIVANVNVSCVPITYSLGGTVSGLAAVNSVTLSLNSGAQTKTVTANSSYTFDTPIAYGASYSVTVATQPVDQLCTVANSSGTMGGANVTNVSVSCVVSASSLGGTVSGLSGGGVTLSLNSGAQTKAVNANGSFAFDTSIATGASYSVTVSTQPTGQICTVAAGSGTMPTHAVTNVDVRCCPTGTLWTGAACSAGWSAVSAGRNHTCGLLSDKTAWCWGANTNGQVGDGTTTADHYSPFQLPGNIDWRVIAAGEWHSCALDGGALLCWGFNFDGEVGDGTGTERHWPVQVGSAYDWVSLTVGDYYSCGIRSSGTLWCWGYNSRGQLGDGTGTNRFAPVQVGNATDWTSVAGGDDHTCGLRGGTLWCWGANDYGQIGDGTAATRYAPVQVGSATDWIGVTSGDYHSCGLRSGGTTWCWGRNDKGQVGDGTTTHRSSPMQVGSSTGWARLAGGDYHTCGVRSDGTLWCWGDNYQGVLGDGTTVGRSTPTQVGSANNWTSVAAGWTHTCGTRSDATLWCWGDNTSGKLGDGTTTLHLSPIQVPAP